MRPQKLYGGPWNIHSSTCSDARMPGRFHVGWRLVCYEFRERMKKFHIDIYMMDEDDDVDVDVNLFWTLVDVGCYGYYVNVSALVLHSELEGGGLK